MAKIQFSLIKEIKVGHPEHSLSPTPKRPITSHFYLFPSTFPILLKVDAICVSPQKWFENLLSDREQGIYFNKKATKTLEMKCGAPQESMLGSIRQCFY